MTNSHSRDLMPGGVSSPVRSAKGLLPKAPLFTHGNGSYIYDNEKRYVDLVNGFGMHILGHQHPTFVSAIQQACHLSLPGGTCHDHEAELASLIVNRIASAEKLRFCVSGTESCMTALRLAKHATGRKAFVTIKGGYHGHGESFLTVNDNHFEVAFNNQQALEQVFEAHGDEIAALMIEPICGNMGMVRPIPGYLKSCQKSCHTYGSLLICDEVMTGFRCQYSTVSDDEGISPDLMCFAKVIGGGLPLACVTGRADLMDMLAPSRPVTHAGTYTSLSTCVLTGLATMSYLTPRHYTQLDEMTGKLTQAIQERAKHYSIPLQTSHKCGMGGLFFARDTIQDESQISTLHHQIFKFIYPVLFEHNVYMPPSSHEACFINLGFADEHIQQTCHAFEKAFQSLKELHGELT